jgi:hypothetical protein
VKFWPWWRKNVFSLSVTFEKKKETLVIFLYLSRRSSSPHLSRWWLFDCLFPFRLFFSFRFILSFRGLRNVFDGNANSRTWRTSGYNDDESSDSTIQQTISTL